MYKYGTAQRRLGKIIEECDNYKCTQLLLTQRDDTLVVGAYVKVYGKCKLIKNHNQPPLG